VLRPHRPASALKQTMTITMPTNEEGKHSGKMGSRPVCAVAFMVSHCFCGTQSFPGLQNIKPVVPSVPQRHRCYSAMRVGKWSDRILPTQKAAGTLPSNFARGPG
jgi:hypothetical protein